MTTIDKLPKWGQEIVKQKDREIRDLTEALEVLRGTAVVDNQVGVLLQSGYRSEPIPLGEYFRVDINGLTISMERGKQLAITCYDGYPAVVPSVSNVIHVLKLDK